MRAINVAVGNCRYAGGGWLAAPRANPEDGLLDVVIIEKFGLSEVLGLTPTALAQADYLDREGVFFARAKEIRVDTQPPLLTSPPTARSSRRARPPHRRRALSRSRRPGVHPRALNASTSP